MIAGGVTCNVRPLQRKLRTFGDRLYKRWMKKAMRAGGTPIARLMRNLASRRTGGLKKSIGKRVKAYPRSKNVIAIIGPRADFAGLPTPEGVVWLRGKKGMQGLRLRPGKRIRPAKYAHLVEFGTKAHVIENWFGHEGQRKLIRGARSRPFVEPAYRQGEQAAFQKIAAKIREGVAAEARRN